MFVVVVAHLDRARTPIDGEPRRGTLRSGFDVKLFQRQRRFEFHQRLPRRVFGNNAPRTGRRDLALF